MDSLILLAIIVATFIIVNVLSGKLKEIQFRFTNLTDELQKLRSELEMLRRQNSSETKEFPATELKTDITPEPEISQPKIQTSEAIVEPELPEPVGQELEKASLPLAENTLANSVEKVPAIQSHQAELMPPMAQEPVYESPQPGFFSRFKTNNPDLEKFIGENLINKIGIAILVLGIGYFVKFAIDKDWINEIGRVFIGVLAGGLLIGVAHYLRKSFTAFSSVLVGGGLAVLYFTIAIAFHEYQLLNQTAAFLIMVVITGFSVLLAISYNRIELAVLAILGGFATPFMVSTGEGNYQVLFTYLLILNIGMLVLAYLKNWKLINWICYVFTVLLFGGWLSNKVLNTTTGAPYLGALVFGTLFYLVFFLMNIINTLRERTQFSASNIAILVSNTFLYYAAGMAIFYYFEEGIYQGLFTVALAVFNFAFAFLLFRRRQADRNLVYLLIGLVITFISLAIPVQLEGNYITMFWALEAVLLLWFAQRTGIKLAMISSIVIMGLMLMSLALDWKAIYNSFPGEKFYAPLLNKGFITGIIGVVSLGVTRYLLQRNLAPISFKYFTFQPEKYLRLVGISLLVVLYLVLALELNYQLDSYLETSVNKTIIMGNFNLAYLAGLLVLARFRKNASLSLWSTFLGLFGLILFVLYYEPQVNRLFEQHFLYNVPEFVGFAFHYLSVLIFVFLLVLVYQNRNLLAIYWPKAPVVLLWFNALALVYVASSELLYHVLYFNLPLLNLNSLSPDRFVAEVHQYFYELKKQTYKFGFPILWGICAFLSMFIGLRRKNKHLRIIALTLFTITLLKLFLFDIRGISEGGKIVAFIFLGVILLVISFMYQNIKKLLLTDEPNPEKENEI